MIALISAAFTMWCVRHEFIKYKTIALLRSEFYRRSFLTVASSSAAYDSIFFATIFGMAIIGNVVTLQLSESIIDYVYVLFYVGASQYFGVAIFLPLFCIHVEFLKRNQKGFSRKSQLIEVGMNLSIICLCLSIVMYTPHDYLLTQWSEGRCPFAKMAEMRAMQADNS